MSTTDPLRSRDTAGDVPPFVPHPLLKNGHLQTVVGSYLGGVRLRLPSTGHEIDAGDGDRLHAWESTPQGWEAGSPVAVMLHGLAGDADAPYVVRLAARLYLLGVRVVRMNLRGAGAGFGLARSSYHAGRSGDVRRVVEWAASRATGSPIGLVGFSLGGNLVLKLAAESSDTPVPGVDCVVAANPPIDLAECCRAIQQPRNRIYDRNFARALRAAVHRLHQRFPDLGPVRLPKPLTVYTFDHHYTAPRNGFDGADDYYARSSAGPLIPRIQLPGLVVHSRDDPFVPVEPFLRVPFPPRLALELIAGGGHLGYVSRQLWGGDRRWLDARLAAWLAGHWGLNETRPGRVEQGASRRAPESPPSIRQQGGY